MFEDPQLEQKIITSKCLLYYSCNCDKIKVLDEDVNDNSKEMVQVDNANTENTIQSNSETAPQHQINVNHCCILIHIPQRFGHYCVSHLLQLDLH